MRSTASIRHALKQAPFGTETGSSWRMLRSFFEATLDLLDEIRCTEHTECIDDPEMGIKCATDRVRRERRDEHIANEPVCPEDE